MKGLALIGIGALVLYALKDKAVIQNGNSLVSNIPTDQKPVIISDIRPLLNTLPGQTTQPGQRPLDYNDIISPYHTGYEPTQIDWQTIRAPIPYQMF